MGERRKGEEGTARGPRELRSLIRPYDFISIFTSRDRLFSISARMGHVSVYHAHLTPTVPPETCHRAVSGYKVS